MAIIILWVVVTIETIYITLIWVAYWLDEQNRLRVLMRRKFPEMSTEELFSKTKLWNILVKHSKLITEVAESE